MIEGVQQLYRMHKRSRTSNMATDYLDSLILRLNTGSQGEWFRNHFPVIFETNMS